MRVLISSTSLSEEEEWSASRTKTWVMWLTLRGAFLTAWSCTPGNNSGQILSQDCASARLLADRQSRLNARNFRFWQHKPDNAGRSATIRSGRSAVVTTSGRCGWLRHIQQAGLGTNTLRFMRDAVNGWRVRLLGNSQLVDQRWRLPDSPRSQTGDRPCRSQTGDHACRRSC
jgi:hypothetical protein